MKLILHTLFPIALLLLLVLPLTTATQQPNPVDEFTTLHCPPTTQPPQTTTFTTQQTTWNTFTTLLYTQKRITEAFTTYAAKDYINHAPTVSKNGLNETIAHLVEVVPSVESELLRSFLGVDKEGNVFGTAVTRVTDGDGAVSVLVDVVRMVGGCLVEHWDVQGLV